MGSRNNLYWVESMRTQTMLLSWVREHVGQLTGASPLGHLHRRARSRNWEKSSELQRRRGQKEKTNKWTAWTSTGCWRQGQEWIFMDLHHLVPGQVSRVLVHGVWDRMNLFSLLFNLMYMCMCCVEHFLWARFLLDLVSINTITTKTYSYAL